MKRPDIGSHVRVHPKHWARGNQYGVIVDPGEEGLDVINVPGRFCVKFEKFGTGIKDHYLFLEDIDFTVQGE